jgi:hypothetical protein
MYIKRKLYKFTIPPESIITILIFIIYLEITLTPDHILIK